MRNILFTVTALLFSTALYADCKEFDLQGNWTVFYQNNAFPTSVLAPDETINIQYLSDADEFSVDLSDPRWKAWDGNWSHECIDGQTVLIGAVERRSGGASLLIEISRVVDLADLLARPSGEASPNQINIHFPDRHASVYSPELIDALTKQGYLASHPGHAHAYD